MKKIILLFALLFSAVSVDAKTNTKYQTAIKMLDVMNKNRLLERHINSMIKMEVANNPLLAMRQKEVMGFFQKYAGFKKIKPQLARIYTKELTSKEMKQFTSFFDTSVGQKMILKMPRLIGLSSNLAQQSIQKHYPELINTFLRR
jgi:hypothetical protein